MTATGLLAIGQVSPSVEYPSGTVPHGEVTSLPSFGIDVLAFSDPDGVQLELTPPMT